MDPNKLRRQAALRARADEAMLAALAAGDPRAQVIADAMKAVLLACWDRVLGPGERLELIDDAMRLMTPLKELASSDRPARAELILQVLRRTNDLLRHYARLVRSDRAKCRETFPPADGS